MGRVTEETLEPGERRLIRQHRPRVTPQVRRFALSASRTAFLFLCIAGTIAAPEPWMRAVLAAPFVLTAYIVGWSDGRKSLALDLLGSRRDDRGTRPAPRSGGELEDG